MEPRMADGGRMAARPKWTDGWMHPAVVPIRGAPLLPRPPSAIRHPPERSLCPPCLLPAGCEPAPRPSPSGSVPVRSFVGTSLQIEGLSGNEHAWRLVGLTCAE